MHLFFVHLNKQVTSKEVTKMFKMQIDEELSLALIDFSFAKQWLAIIKNEREYLSEWLSWPLDAYDESFYLDFTRSQLQLYAENKALTCIILYKDQYVGNVSFNSLNHELKCCEIGYWLSKKFQGKGIMSRSVTKMISLGFEKYDMHKIKIAVAIENRKSRAVPERLGFNVESIIIKREKMNGKLFDFVIYGISREDWYKLMNNS